MLGVGSQLYLAVSSKGPFPHYTSIVSANSHHPVVEVILSRGTAKLSGLVCAMKHKVRRSQRLTLGDTRKQADQKGPAMELVALAASSANGMLDTGSQAS